MMINLVKNMSTKGDIGKYVKKGFFDPLLIVKVFEQIKPE